jgi:hypothetical protein
MIVVEPYGDKFKRTFSGLETVDKVDTFIQLKNYDTSKLKYGDIVFILNDETHNNKSSYYEWNEEWVYIEFTQMYIQKVGTSEKYVDAIDLKTSTFEYVETDEKIEPDEEVKPE